MSVTLLVVCGTLDHYQYAKNHCRNSHGIIKAYSPMRSRAASKKLSLAMA